MDKEALFEKSLPEETVELGPGRSVRVRALTRDEALKVADRELSKKRAEQLVLSKAMVDPMLTEDEVGRWQRSSAAGEIQRVFDTVTRLSGLEDAKAAAKSGVPDVRDED